MKNLEEIIEKIDIDIDALERSRKKAKKGRNRWKGIGVLSGIGALILSIFLVLAFGPQFIILGLIVMAILLGTFFEISKGPVKKFQHDFKQNFVRKLIKAFNPNLVYEPDRIVSKSDFTFSKLFKKDPDRILGEDFLSGTHGETKFRFSELNPQYKVKTKKGTRWVDIFKGFFMVADFHKYFHSETYILPESFWSKAGMSKKKFQGADLIKMEDDKFEEKFRVFSTNDTDARYILSPVMMEKISQIQEQYGDDVFISFRGKNMYIALETKQDFFKHDVNTSIDKHTIMNGHLSELKSIMAIIDDLNLNTRIWSKIPISLGRTDELENG